MEDLSPEEMKQYFRSILDITLCPICLDPVKPDMVQCVNYHFICTECKRDLYNCPTCRDEFSDSRPPGYITQVLDALPPRCKHKHCGKLLKNDSDHETYCGFRQTPCKLYGCEWKGPLTGIQQHIAQQHPDEVVFTESNNGVVFNDFNIEENQERYILYSFKDQFFWHQISHDVEEGHLFHKFHFIPHGKPIGDYFVKISSNSAAMKFSFKIKLNLDPNVENTEGFNYITLPKYMIHHFVIEDKLHCNVSFKHKPVN